MNWNHQFLCLTILRISLGLSVIPILPGFALAEPLTLDLWALSKTRSSKISQNFTPPDRGAPTDTAGGGIRGITGCGLTGKKALIPLIPKGKLGLTLSDRPTFYLFLPPSTSTTSKTGQFSLLDKAGNLIFESPFILPNKSGIVGFTPPEKTLNLAVGQQYRWFVTVACDEDPDAELIGDVQTIEGRVEKIAPNPKLFKTIASARPSQLSRIYAQSGIWYEAVDSLVKQRCTNPGDKAVLANWKTLLKSESVGLDDLGDEPLAMGCAPKTN
jgi:hypothetical protein